jgi:uncharacterized membrane protein
MARTLHSTAAMTRTIPPEKTVARSQRVVLIDLLRGLALLLMALDHAFFMAHSPILAEGYGGVLPFMSSPIHIIIGLLTNVASGVFFVLAGLSVALYEANRRQRGQSERSITRYFWVRALLLVVIDMTVATVMWSQPVTVDVLTSIAFALVVLMVVRHWRTRWIALLAAALFVLYPLLVAPLGTYNPDYPLTMIGTVLFNYYHSHTFEVEFPLLSRLSIVLCGYVVGRLLVQKRLTISVQWLWAAGAVLVAWFVVRLNGGYGEFLPFRSGQAWPYFFIMNKQPPDSSFLLFNLALGILMLVALHRLQSFIEPLRAGRWLVLLGQTSLFFYIAHLVVYGIISRVVPTTFFYRYSLARGLIEYLAGLVILLPLTMAYHRLRRKYPDSVLRYL